MDAPLQVHETSHRLTKPSSCLQTYLKPQGNYEKGEHENLNKLILCAVHGGV